MFLGFMNLVFLWRPFTPLGEVKEKSRKAASSCVRSRADHVECHYPPPAMPRNDPLFGDTLGE